MTRFHYLLLGYALIWIALGVYLHQLHRRLSQVQRDLVELERLSREESSRSRGSRG